MSRVERYIADFYALRGEDPGRQDYLGRTELEAYGTVVDEDVARLLAFLVRLTGARAILELGTSVGFSTVSMARALGEGGGITTVEFDPVVAAQAGRNFERLGLAGRIELLLGDAREVVPALAGPYDLVFMDLAKPLYPVLLSECVRLLRPGGLLVAEDTLFPVIDLDERWRDLVPPIEAFNRLLAESAALETVMLPVGDGVSLARKL